MDIKGYSWEELHGLAVEIRQKILGTVSKNGGHLSSSLGAVDLIIAMHAVFDSQNDPFIFDVSHQAYAHKLLTDREEIFSTLRQFGGMSGYTKPKESKHDYFVAGHSSTSISVAVGAAKGIALKGENRTPIVLIGDGAMSAGMVYEALNELGDRKYPVVIIINDNEMSIAKPIGAISRYLSQALASKTYQGMKKWVGKILEKMPPEATYLAKRFEESLRLITPGLLFEELGIEYIGPVDGHDIKGLIEVLTRAKEMRLPVIIHAQTTKGKGYDKAEGSHEHWHGVGPFNPLTGESLKKAEIPSATEIFGQTLLELAHGHDNVVGLTAAMPSGTGLKYAMEVYPQRFWDVGIAEQHAVTSAAALAKEGFRPFCALYSTFLQRGFDQVVHDVALAELGVIFAIDRAGIVGEDGETHQGAFDISYLRPIPGITLFAPRDNTTLIDAINYAYTLVGPCAFRYPRGNFLCSSKEYPSKGFYTRKLEILEEGDEALFIGYGNGVGRALRVREKMGRNIAVVDLRFVKPLDHEGLASLAKRFSRWFVFSDSAKIGGVGSALMEWAHSRGESCIINSFEYDDVFITHGATSDVERSLGLDEESLVKFLQNSLSL